MSDTGTTNRAGRAARVTAEDLAALMDSFNAVTSKLQTTHDSLRAEVARLTRQLTEANAALERSRRLAALGEMAAGIAHEVRNPLGGIRLYARLLEQDLAAQAKPLELAVKIGSAAKNIDQIVGDVLTFSREFKLRRERTGVADLFARSLEACRHDGVAGWERVAIEGLDDLEPIEASVDPGLVLQALTNIVRNAFESMAQVGGEGHRLSFFAERRRAANADGAVGGAVVLRIADTGAGISGEVMQRMFNPFFTTRAAGTGLGLAIVHRIIDAHGGRITIKNREGTRGAEAELVFPDRSDELPEESADGMHTPTVAKKPETK